MSEAVEIINSSAKQKAPSISKGLQPQTLEELLANLSPEHVQSLMKENFALWAQYAGIKVDGNRFSFDKHRYLLPMYLDTSHHMVWRKAAQLGATVFLLLKLIWFSRYHPVIEDRYSVKCGLYFPTGDGVEKLSKDRLGPLIRSNDELYSNIRDGENIDTLGLKQINNIHGDKSSLYMLYVGGSDSKDSVPLDLIAFDEVRLMDDGDIDQIENRIAHSPHKYKLFMSTCGFPGTDIDKRFQEGTQLRWHVNCGSPAKCPDGFIPADTFPDCVIEWKGKFYLRCPRCKNVIRDPQNGRYVAHNPGASYNSYAVSQFISKYISVEEIWDKFITADNISEFYNARLGLPFVDENLRPVNDDVLDSCTNSEIKWAYESGAPSDLKQNCAMGIDVGKGYCYVIIAKKNKRGTRQIVHIELIEQDNPDYWRVNKHGERGPVSPFIRCGELMEEFDVKVCVVDGMPNANESLQMAREFRGKVWVAFYSDTQSGDVALWKDRVTYPRSQKKVTDEIRNKFQVNLARFTSLDYSLRLLVDQAVQIPHPKRIKCKVRNEKTGLFEFECLADRFRDHLKRLVKREEIVGDKELGKTRWVWVFMGGDPHFAHAFNYAMVALERMPKRGNFGFV